jgi:hypothetical protein
VLPDDAETLDRSATLPDLTGRAPGLSWLLESERGNLLNRDQLDGGSVPRRRVHAKPLYVARGQGLATAVLEDVLGLELDRAEERVEGDLGAELQPVARAPLAPATNCAPR